MWDDEIMEELRAARDKYAAQFNYDLCAIYEDLKRQEQASSRQIVSLPARRITPEPMSVRPDEHSLAVPAPEPEAVLPSLSPDTASN